MCKRAGLDTDLNLQDGVHTRRSLLRVGSPHPSCYECLFCCSTLGSAQQSWCEV
jgi:hypothetical protein